MASGEIVVGFVEKAASGSSAVDTMIQSANSGTSKYELVNNGGQIIASVTGMFPILAPIAIQTNTLAGTMTFLKIVVDVKDGKSIQTGDVLNLVGNVAGIIASVTILAGVAPTITAVAGAIAIGSAIAGVVTADGGLRDWTLNQIHDFWPSQPVINLNDYWIDTNGNARRYWDLVNDPDPNVGFRVIVIDKNAWRNDRLPEPPPAPRPTEPEEVDGDGQM